MILVAMGEQHRSTHAVTDDVEECRPVLGNGIESFVDDLLQAGCQTKAATTCRKPNLSQSEVELGSQEFKPIPGGVILGE